MGSVLGPWLEGFSILLIDRIYFLSKYSSFLNIFLNCALSEDFSMVFEVSTIFFFGDSTLGFDLLSS